MDTLPQHDPLNEEAFRGFESFRFPTPPPPRYPTPPESNYFISPQPSFYDAASPCTPEAFPISTPIPPLCIQCKGNKYGFTAYFHNLKIFPEPPHHLLHLVEQSYFLRDRLKSLLVTYAMRPLETDQTQGIEDEIQAWSREVVCFSNHVLCSATMFELRVRPLDEVKRWTFEMSKQLADHIRGDKKLEMPKGRLQVLLVEFRRAFELVWKAYLEDQGNPAAQYPQNFCQSAESLDVSQWVEG